MAIGALAVFGAVALFALVVAKVKAAKGEASE